jgi:hypothetical protein
MIMTVPDPPAPVRPPLHAEETARRRLSGHSFALLHLIARVEKTHCLGRREVKNPSSFDAKRLSACVCDPFGNVTTMLRRVNMRYIIFVCMCVFTYDPEYPMG